MKINIEQTTKQHSHHIIIADAGLKFFKNYSFSKKETEFIKSEFNAEKELAYINRYDESFYIVKFFESNYSNNEKYRNIGSRIFASLKTNKIDQVSIDGLSSSQNALLVTEGIALSSYSFEKYLSKKSKYDLKKISLIGKYDKAAIEILKNTIAGTFITRDLVQEPVITLTAEKLSKEIAKLSKEAGFKFEYFNKKKIEALKMGGLLGVNKGSAEPPTFNILEHKPVKAKNKKPLIFVGKGVVFDTGGISLKPSQSMEQMKGDMAGAAAVVGAIYAIAKSKLPYHVIGLIPATDNRIDANAIVVSDIITISDGTTVEVLNTDAEGRLILSDALHYAKKYNPELVIDLATLTGAAVMTIGDQGMIAMEKNASNEYAELEKAGYEVYERMCKLPLWDEYNDQLKSLIADVKNIGGPKAGSITAGKFLERFTNYPWIHLDLSNALADAPKGYKSAIGTGAGARLLVQFVKNRLS